MVRTSNESVAEVSRDLGINTGSTPDGIALHEVSRYTAMQCHSERPSPTGSG